MTYETHTEIDLIMKILIWLDDRLVTIVYLIGKFFEVGTVEHDSYPGYFQLEGPGILITQSDRKPSDVSQVHWHLSVLYA